MTDQLVSAIVNLLLALNFLFPEMMPQPAVPPPAPAAAAARGRAAARIALRPGGRGRRRWLGGAAGRSAAQVPERGAGVGLAVGLPRNPHLPGSGDRTAPPAPSPRDGPAAGGAGRGAPGRPGQAGEPAHLAPFVRGASPGGRPRHPHGAGAAGPPRRHRHHGLHPRPQPRARRRSPAGRILDP